MLDQDGKEIPRISWYDYFMKIAQTVAKRSTCSRAQVGALFVRDNRILTTGYNGSPSGIAHCNHEADYWNYDHTKRQGKDLIDGHCCVSLHAELNGIIQAAIIGISLKDSTLYCTHEPCLDCTKALIQVGCVGFKWLFDYSNEKARELRQQVFGIEI